MAFPNKARAMAASASPPDVGRRRCPALGVLFTFGLCPSCGLWPNKLRAKPEPGPSPEIHWPLRRGEATARHSGGKADTNQHPTLSAKATAPRQ